MEIGFYITLGWDKWKRKNKKKGRPDDIQNEKKQIDKKKQMNTIFIPVYNMVPIKKDKMKMSN